MPGRELPAKLWHAWSTATPVFDDAGLVSYAGLIPVMGLAQAAGLHDLVARRVGLGPTRVRSAGVNPAGKVAAIVAGMAAGADSIDDLDAIRAGGMPAVFGGVYAAATLGHSLRELTHGHVQHLASVTRGVLVGLVQRSPVLPGIEQQEFIDINSLLRPVHRHAKDGASFGHTKVSGKAVLAAIASIPADAWPPVSYPGAVIDADTGEWISDAQVAEVPAFTGFASIAHPVTARPGVRRVGDAAVDPKLFDVWRDHPFLTNNTEPAPATDVTHRQHAIIETTFGDLIDGPLAHQPSGGSTPTPLAPGRRPEQTLAQRLHPRRRATRNRLHTVGSPANPLLGAPSRRGSRELPAPWRPPRSRHLTGRTASGRRTTPRR